jgi:hypothetical protein
VGDHFCTGLDFVEHHQEDRRPAEFMHVCLHWHEAFNKMEYGGCRSSPPFKVQWLAVVWNWLVPPIFEPLDFIGKLVTLVPRQGVNLTRFVRIFPDTHPLRGRANVDLPEARRRSPEGLKIPNSEKIPCGI